MGARTWRTTTTCAALLLTATGCMVGPTIKDTPKKPAAAASDLPTVQATGQGAAPPGGQQPPGGNSNPQPVPTTASPTPTRQTYAIGGEEPFEFAPGMKLWVQEIAVQGPIPVGAPGRQKVAVRILVSNDSGGDLRPYGLIVTLRGCPSPNGTCSTPGDGPDREEPTTIPVGGEQQLVRYFAVTNTAELSKARVEVAYNTARAAFARP